jgi:hypothetical protein
MVSLLKKALSEHCVEQVHRSFGNPPQVIQVQKFVTVFVTIGGQCVVRWERMKTPFARTRDGRKGPGLS